MTSRRVDFIYRLLRGGADYGFLRALGSPTLRCDDSGEIKMSLSGTFDPVARDAAGNIIEANYLTDEIEPVLVLDGVEHRLGVFLPATVTPTESDGTQRLVIEAFDRCWKVRDNYTTARLYYAAGTPYLTAIEQLLTEAGLTTVLATPTAAAFTEAREDWDIGTSYLSIVNQLLGEINYNPLWFDNAGIAVLEPASVPTAANIEHTLDADDVESLILPVIMLSLQIRSA